MGLAQRALGHNSQAHQCLVEALRRVVEAGAFLVSLFSLCLMALPLAGRGDMQRAIGLYALASRYPFVTNSRHLEDTVGKHIAALAATLPPEGVAAAQQRGRGRDLDATVAELLRELEAAPDGE
jgi:hypothetical protein